jgi:VCBS repeat-containing protein
MKFKSVVLIAVFVLLFASVGILFAQEPTPIPRLSQDGSIGNEGNSMIHGDRAIQVTNQNFNSDNSVDSEETIFIAEYSVPISPTNLLINQTGDIWFSSFNDNAIGKLNPTSREVTVYSRQDDNGSVWAVKQDSTGSIWYTTVNASDDVVGKFDPSTNTFQEWAVPDIESHFGLEIDPVSGDVWFASHRGGICKLSPATNSLDVWATSVYTDFYDLDIASDGSIWFTVQPYGNQGVGNLNPTTGEINAWEMPVGGSRPFRVVATTSDEIWFTEYATVANSIAQLLPSTNMLNEFQVPVPDSFPGGLVKDGNKIWFTARGANSIGQLQPSLGSPVTNNLSPITLQATKTTVSVTPNSYAATVETTLTDVIDKQVTTSSSGAYTLLSLPTSDSSPFGITTGSTTEEVWFTASGANYIGKLVASSSLEADLGFRPNPDGYDFDNYGGNFPWGDYDFGYDELIRMFGQDDVCWMVGSVCLVKPSADWWHFQANRAMNGGHCDGMASTSLRFFKELDTPSDFQGGASTTHDLQLDNARRHIAYYFVEQMTDPVKAYKQQIRQNSPSVILEQLIVAMSGTAPDPTTLFVRQAGQGGHAITPYAIENKGNDVYWVKVYDNNHPDDANRHVVITTTTNTWSYDLGWTTWSGDTNTDSLGIVPISKYAEQPVCPWASNTRAFATATGGQAEQVWLTGQGHLLIADSQGRRIGYVGNQFVNEVPGAYESIIDNGLGVEQEPIYTLPLTETYTILLDGQTLPQVGNVTLTQFGPAYAATLSNVALSPTSQDLLTIAADGKRLTYRPNSNKEATLILALDGSSKSNQFQIKGADIGASQTVTASINIGESQLAFDNSQTNGGTYNFEVTQMDTTGKHMFIHSNLVVSATDTHYFDYGGFASTDVVTLTVDYGSDGTLDETKVLENQIKRVYLPLIVK